MSNEASIRSGMTIRVGNLYYESKPQAFTGTVTGTKGPSPGALTIPPGGKIVSFEELSTPGYCRLMNMDLTNFVEWGVYDPALDIFYPIGEILPGETYVIRLSRNIQEEYEGTGTGTTQPANYFFMKANVADVNVLVEAFES